MSRIKSMAVAALLTLGSAGHLANAASPVPVRSNTASSKEYAQADGIGVELPLETAQQSAPQSQDADPWAVTSRSGVHVPSRSGFVGYR